ncbi:MAG: nucleoside triphosphate pyrophosphohydrolase [Thermoleophilia bacterium]|nr:nucleoside triphosphate pyrophosphohydrolase [Thermoleophilia bacterium]
MLPDRAAPWDDSADPPDGAAVALPDAAADALARHLPGAATVPDRATLRNRAIGARVAELAAVGWHLRTACPWDREQTAASIVPHTIEEAYEVADAVADGDPAKQRDELGDLLFQAVFLSQLLEERGEGDLGDVARGQVTKLISRHPHVYGDARAREAGQVVDLWERNKRAERADQGIFHDLPDGLPSVSLATKAQKRAAAVGFVFGGLPDAVDKLCEEVAELVAAPSADELGDVLFAAVAVARHLGSDPDLALRATTRRFRARVEAAAALASRHGERFEDLPPERQLEWYARARMAE